MGRWKGGEREGGRMFSMGLGFMGEWEVDGLGCLGW